MTSSPSSVELQSAVFHQAEEETANLFKVVTVSSGQAAGLKAESSPPAEAAGCVVERPAAEGLAERPPSPPCPRAFSHRVEVAKPDSTTTTVVPEVR